MKMRLFRLMMSSFLICCVITTFYAVVGRIQHASAAADPYYGQAVAAVYKIGPNGFFYHIHNGMFIRLDANGITISHVNEWDVDASPHVQRILICWPNVSLPQCWRQNQNNPNTRWRLQHIFYYPSIYDGVPYDNHAIAFKEGLEEPHNGAFLCFRQCPRSTWPGSITNQVGEFWYLHYVNPTPPAGYRGRVALHWYDFQLRSGSTFGVISARRLVAIT
jgi:hypothetical protein